MTNTNNFIGRWRIVEMDTWDREALGLVGPATLTISRGGEGRMYFIAVELWIDYRIDSRDGLPTIELSFQGSDEGDESTLVAERMRGRAGSK